MMHVDLSDDELANVDPKFVDPRAVQRMAVELKRRRAIARVVPEALLAGIDRYRQGVAPGSCLRCVLEGDLFGAFQRADPDTSAAMVAIVRYIRDHLASSTYGSPEAVSRYLLEAEQNLRSKR